MNNDRLVNICVYGKWHYIKFSKLIDLFRKGDIIDREFCEDPFEIAPKEQFEEELCTYPRRREGLELLLK